MKNEEENQDLSVQDMDINGGVVVAKDDNSNLATTVSKNEGSYFDGSTLGLIGISLLFWCLIAFTLGIGTPWAVCKYHSWKSSHTVINGRRLKFVGTPGDFFKIFIKCFLLTIITCGIYSIWLYVAEEKWVAKNKTLDDAPNTSQSTDTQSNESNIDFGKIKEFVIKNKILVVSLAAIFIIVPIVISRCSVSDNYDDENLLGLRPDDYYENMYVNVAGVYAFQGFIDGKYPITMQLNIDENGFVYGTYYYDKVKTDIYLQGTISEDYEIFMEESTDVDANNLTGSFSGFLDVNDLTFSGIFHGYERDNRLSFSLTQ